MGIPNGAQVPGEHVTTFTPMYSSRSRVFNPQSEEVQLLLGCALSAVTLYRMLSSNFSALLGGGRLPEPHLLPIPRDRKMFYFQVIFPSSVPL